MAANRNHLLVLCLEFHHPSLAGQRKTEFKVWWRVGTSLGGACLSQTLPLDLSAERGGSSMSHASKSPPPPSLPDKRLLAWIGHQVTLLCNLGQVTSLFWASVCEMRGWTLVDPRVLSLPWQPTVT